MNDLHLVFWGSSSWILLHDVSISIVFSYQLSLSYLCCRSSCEKTLNLKDWPTWRTHLPEGLSYLTPQCLSPKLKGLFSLLTHSVQQTTIWWCGLVTYVSMIAAALDKYNWYELQTLIQWHCGLSSFRNACHHTCKVLHKKIKNHILCHNIMIYNHCKRKIRYSNHQIHLEFWIDLKVTTSWSLYHMNNVSSYL